MTPESLSSQATQTRHFHRLSALGLVLAALLTAAGATAFFATAGPVDPLRDTLFSLAISLDLLTIFLTWQAVRRLPQDASEVIAFPPLVSPVPRGVLVPTLPPDQAAVPWVAGGWRYVVLFLAAISYGASMGMYYAGPESPWTRVLWGVGLFGLILAYVPRPRPRAVRDVPWWEVILVLLLLTGAVALRAYRLEIMPLHVHGDMASVGLQARALLQGEQRTWFNAGWATIPMWGYAPEALTMALFGDSLFGLRMSAVLGGTLSLLAVYLLGREAWSSRVGLVALAVLAIDVVHLHFSRIPSYIDPLPWLVFALYFAVRGYRRRSPFSWLLAGICTALATHMYFSGRLVALILVLFLVYLNLFHRRTGIPPRNGDSGATRSAAIPIAALLGLLFALGPMLIYDLKHWDLFLSRAQHVSLTDPGVYRHLLTKYQADSLREVILEQVRRTFLTYQYYGDTSTQFGYPDPMLSPWLAPFFLLGVGVASGRLRHAGNFLLVTWLFWGLVLGSVVTVDAPSWPRLVVILPANALAVALGLVWLWSLLAEGAVWWRHAILIVLTTGLLLWVGWQNWQAYTAHATTYVGKNPLVARYILTLGDRPACVVQGEHSLTEREFAFLLAGRQDVEVRIGSWAQDILPCVQAHGAVITLPQERPILEQVARKYPGGRWEEVRSPTGTFSFSVYHLP